MGDEQEAIKDDGSSTVGTAADVMPNADSPLARVRAALAGLSARRVIGWVLLVGWLVWLVALWVAQPRLVSQDHLVADLAEGRVTAYRAVTLEQDGGGMFSPAYRIEVLPTSRGDGLDVGEDGRPVTIAYWVDAPVASLRVLDPDGAWSDAAATVVEDLARSGVPEADLSSVMNPPAQRTYNAGALLLLLTFGIIVAGARPRRGTRWFWFWLLAVPLAAVVPIFAVAELLRPRYEPEGIVHPPGVAGRWSGLAGVALGFASSLVVGAVLLALSGVSPVWLIRG